MRRQFWLVTMGMLLGCTNAGPGKGVLPENEMVKVLWDMIQVDELATFYLVKDTSKDVKKERIQLYQKVFKLHNTSEKQFSTSFTYYSNHPAVMKVLFDSLEARGVRERKNSYMTVDSLAK